MVRVRVRVSVRVRVRVSCMVRSVVKERCSDRFPLPCKVW